MSVHTRMHHIKEQSDVEQGFINSDEVKIHYIAKRGASVTICNRLTTFLGEPIF
jgi:hypothetical protein